jgi:hypothetical protein
MVSGGFLLHGRSCSLLSLYISYNAPLTPPLQTPPLVLHLSVKPYSIPHTQCTSANQFLSFHTIQHHATFSKSGSLIFYGAECYTCRLQQNPVKTYTFTYKRTSSSSQPSPSQNIHTQPVHTRRTQASTDSISSSTSRTQSYITGRHSDTNIPPLLPSSPITTSNQRLQHSLLPCFTATTPLRILQQITSHLTLTEPIVIHGADYKYSPPRIPSLSEPRGSANLE